MHSDESHRVTQLDQTVDAGPDEAQWLAEEDDAGPMCGKQWGAVEDVLRAMESARSSVLVKTVLHATAADIWMKPPGELLIFIGRHIEARGGDTWQNS